MASSKGPALGWDSIFTLPVAITFAAVVQGFEYATKLGSAICVISSFFACVLLWLPSYADALADSIRGRVGETGLHISTTTIFVLVVLGGAKALHDFLNYLSFNNFRFISQATYDWPNEIAVVTGAAGGIGAAIVEELAAKGIQVIAVDIVPLLPEELGKNAKVHYYRCDITSLQNVLHLAANIKKEHGSPSILVNNAGVAYMHHTLNASETALRRLFDVNILSHYWTIQAFLPDMIEKKKGHIASTASIASFFAGLGLGPYSATKAAVLAQHEALHQELRRIHHAPEIQLTIVHPTFVQTAMTRHVKTELEKLQEIITPQTVSNAICGNIFARRGGQIVLPGSLGPFPVLVSKAKGVRVRTAWDRSVCLGAAV